MLPHAIQCDWRVLSISTQHRRNTDCDRYLPGHVHSPYNIPVPKKGVNAKEKQSKIDELNRCVTIGKEIISRKPFSPPPSPKKLSQ